MINLLRFYTEEPWSEIKLNPSTNKLTKYTFYYVNVVFSETIDNFKNIDVTIGGTKYLWKTLTEIRDHAATKQLNNGAFIELSKRYGRNKLDKISFSLTHSIYELADPYAPKARNYDDLSWVKDDKLFNLLLPTNILNSVGGIIDLGCGTGSLGYYLKEHLNRIELNYVGIDSSSSMIHQAEQNLKKYENVKLLQKNIKDDLLESKTNDYLFVFKNVLHVLSPLGDVFASLFDKYGKPKYITISETVSPGQESICFIKRLFEILGKNYKFNWFRKGDIPCKLKYYNLNPISIKYHKQHIEVESWLKSFGVAEEVEKNITFYKKCSSRS